MSNNAPVAGPYADRSTNFLYQLLFCDDASLFNMPAGPSPQAPWQKILFDPQPDPDAIRGLAADAANESRVRVLAYNWLRQHGHAVPKGELLGAIIEIGLDRGLDVLAAYTDGRIRYLNQTGKPSIFEAAPPGVAKHATRALAAAQIVIAQIGPWDKPRLPHPPQGTIRMSFLVSDGLYFGQGPWPGMSRDPIAAPLIAEFGHLLKAVVDAAIGAGKPRPAL
ncbi:MAG TPA: hypothetical protein VGL53_08205 [Bryobacteraceae bacterium]|jgi:hypothetical protein